MGLISRALPNLIGGMSQQPASQRAINQVELMLNAIPDITKGVIKRPGTEHKAHLGAYLGSMPFYHATRRDSLNKFHYLITRENGVTAMKVLDNAGNVMTLNRNTDIIERYLDSDSPKSSYRAVSISDVTYILNTEKVAAISPDVTPSRPKEGLAYLKGTNYDTTYTITVTKGYDTRTFSYTTWHATQEDTSAAQQAEDSVELQNVLNQFYVYFNSNLPAGMSVNKIGATLHFYNVSTAEENFTLAATDSAGGIHLNAYMNEVEAITDLPNIGPQGFEIIVKGANDKSTDDYWVRCDGAGWSECVAQGATYKYDMTTLPIQIRLDDDGEFYMEYMTFEDRVVGDDTTNPFPTFIGNKINDMFFYKDRLGFVAGENIILSRLNSYGEYDFFRVTTLTDLDTDPIDISVTTDILNYAIPFSGSLLVFSDSYQFKLTSNGPLTASTAQVSHTTNFNAARSCKPVGVGKYAYFGSTKGVHGSVFEFEADATQSVFIASIDDATEISAHCPELLVGNVTKLNVSPNNKIIIAETDESLNDLYLYNYFWKEKQKVQSAWSKWTFSGQVVGTHLEGDELSLIMLRDNALYFEQININTDAAEIENGSFSVHLDRRVRLSDGGWERLPYTTTAVITFVDNDGILYNQTAAYAAVQDGTTIWAGENFNTTLEFSEAFIDVNDIAVVTAKLQLRRYYIIYVESCYFTCHKKGKTSYKEFNARFLSDPANVADGIVRTSGIFKFSCSGRSTKSRAILENNSHLPCQIQGASWEAYLTNRSQPM